MHLASFSLLRPGMQQARLLALSLHLPEVAHAEDTAEPNSTKQGAEEG